MVGGRRLAEGREWHPTLAVGGRAQLDALLRGAAFEIMTAKASLLVRVVLRWCLHSVLLAQALKTERTRDLR